MNNTTPKINIRAGNEEYNGKSEEELRALLDEKKAELEGVEPPNNQQGMPDYHAQRAGIFTAMARLYRKLAMTEAADLADVSARAEEKAGRSWQRALNGEPNSNAEGGGRTRRRRKSKKRPSKSHSKK